MKREVIIVRQQPVTMFGAFFAFILICMFWKWVLLIIGSIAAVVLFSWLTRAIWQDLREQAEIDALSADVRKARNEEAAARADRQLFWFQTGDPRAIYGEDFDGEEERR